VRLHAIDDNRHSRFAAGRKFVHFPPAVPEATLFTLAAGRAVGAAQAAQGMAIVASAGGRGAAAADTVRTMFTRYLELGSVQAST
jgi:hypothetical protein